MIKMNHRKMMMIRFAGLYAVSLALLIIIFSAFTQPSPAVIYKEPAGFKSAAGLQKWMDNESKLRDKFAAIQVADDELIALRQNAGKDADVTTADNKSREAAITFRALLDDFTGPAVAIDAETEKRNQSRSFFLSLLESRNSLMLMPRTNQPVTAAKPDMQRVAALEKVIVEKNEQITALSASPRVVTDTKEIQQLRNELAAKNKQLAQLRSQPSNAQPGLTNNVALIKDLEKRNANLSAGFYSIQTQIGVLTKKYNQLKSENTVLKAQQKR